MVFSDTTNKNGAIQRCEDWTGLGDGGISGDSTLLKKFTGHLNASGHELYSLALESIDGWDLEDPNQTDMPVLTTPLVANQRYYTIPISENVLKFKRADVCWDGTSGTCYRAFPFDTAEREEGVGNDSDVDAQFDRTEPGYDLLGNTVGLYPRATGADEASGVLRTEWVRAFSEHSSTDTTQTPWMDVLFQELWVVKASYKWVVVYKSDNASLLSRMEAYIAKEEAKFAAHYSNKQQDRQYVMTDGLGDYNGSDVL